VTKPIEEVTVRERAAWDRVRYANAWEDADVLCEALANVARGGRLLSIASAGDNVLALLTLDPAEVVAVDLSGAQLACLELRLAAFRRLEHAQVLAFLGVPGVSPVSDRRATYRGLRADLSADARAFWDGRAPELAQGIMHAGRFEDYFRVFRRWVLPCIHGRATLRALREPRPLEAQRVFYRERWDTWRWRLLFRVFFSRVVMGRVGRDPAFFSHVQGAVGARILERTRHALSEIPVASNPYLAYIVTGNFPPEALPRYLRAEHFDIIRERVSRVRLVRAAVERAAVGRFEGFNLSDLFEYMSPDEHADCYARLVAAASPGARLVYWNMLVPRGIPDALAGRVCALAERAAELHARDRAWFYCALHVDEVGA
jgi:S-adenosylmethionine:diacylglycerol 3-amino-3-carboxypropyl transferase